MVKRLNVAFDEEQFQALLRWKARYAEATHTSPDDMTWETILMAYSNSTRLP